MTRKPQFSAASHYPVVVYTANEFVRDIHGPNEEILGGCSKFIAVGARVALNRAKVGAQVRCLGTVSNDMTGQSFVNALEDGGVDTCLMLPVDEPTMMAVVKKAPGKETEYLFPNGDCNAMLAVNDMELTEIHPNERKIFCLGSVCAFTSKNYWLGYAKKHSEDALVMFDMNTRPALIKDFDQHRKDVLEWASKSHVMKVSDADLTALYGDDVDMAAKAQEFIDCGVRVVVLTRGDKIPMLFSANNDVILGRDLVRPLECTNTVGAGDNFFSGLAAGFAKRGVFTGQAIDAMTRGALLDVLATACDASYRHLFALGGRPKRVGASADAGPK